MKRRQFIVAASSAAAIGIAGCTGPPEPVVDVDGDIRRQNDGIVVKNLKVSDDGSCFHEYEGVIINQRDENLQNIDITIHIYDSSGLLLSSITLTYRLLRAEQIQEFHIERENHCWDEEEAVDYAVEVS